MIVDKPVGVKVNNRIRAREVRLISEEGEQVGILSLKDALVKASEAGLDLVEVAPESSPPVCRIMDYGKYLYEQKKRGKESKKRQRVTHLKEIKMRPKISEHDYQFKTRHAQRFLEAGDKAKITMMFRGREMAHIELGRRILDRLAEDLAEISVIERSPTQEGKNMVMILAPGKH